MAKKDPDILNVKKRWLRRSVIPLAETISSALVMAAIALTGLWFFKQKDNFDPEERDLNPSLLANENTRELYHRPMKYWQENGVNGVESQVANLSPFPDGIFDEVWQPNGRIRKFQSDNLFEKINGEAEKFLKQNFSELHYLVLKSAQDQSEIAIELFDHQDLKSSIGIFSGHLTGDNELLSQGSVNYFRTGAGMIGRKGRFFFRVTTPSLNDNTLAKINQLSEGFGELEENASEFPFEYRLLSETFGIPGGSIAYVTQNAFQYDFADDFWFGTLEGEQNKNTNEAPQVFIHAEESVEATLALYGKLLQELDFDYETLESDANSTLLKHRFLDSYFVLHHSNNYIFGVDKLSSISRAPELMSAIRESINGAEQQG